jgi:RNA polymerase sigma-70 factor (ECF subfamily)
MADTPHSLLERLRKEPDALTWERFVALYTPLIRGWLRRYALLDHDADDLVQEVLGVVVRELPQFEHSRRPGAFRNWLRTITANRTKNFLRAERSRPASTGAMEALDQLADPNSDLSRLWNQEHDRHVTHRLLELIAPEFEPTTWQAFHRVTVGGEKSADVAQNLGISVNAVYIARSRIMARLREEGQGLIE